MCAEGIDVRGVCWWAVQDLNLPPRRSPRPPSAYSSRATAQHTWGSVQVQAFQLEWQRSRMLHEHFERNLTSRLSPRRGPGFMRAWKMRQVMFGADSWLQAELRSRG